MIYAKLFLKKDTTNWRWELHATTNVIQVRVLKCYLEAFPEK